MEKQLFTRPEDGGWDIADTMVFMFFPVTLLHAIGEHEAGAHFDCATIDYENGILTLSRGDNNEEEWKYSLKLVVGNRLSSTA